MLSAAIAKYSWTDFGSASTIVCSRSKYIAYIIDYKLDILFV